jgi:hypothetical protein
MSSKNSGSEQFESRLQEYKAKIALRRKAAAHDFDSYGGAYSHLQWTNIWSERLNKEAETAFSYEDRWGFYRDGMRPPSAKKPPKVIAKKSDKYKFNNIVAHDFTTKESKATAKELKASDFIAKPAEHKPLNHAFIGNRPLSSKGRRTDNVKNEKVKTEAEDIEKPILSSRPSTSSGIRFKSTVNPDILEVRPNVATRPSTARNVSNVPVGTQNQSAYPYLTGQDRIDLRNMLEKTFRDIYGPQRAVSSFSRVNHCKKSMQSLT